MFFAARERTAQGAYLFFKRRNARVPFCNRSGECCDSALEGCGIAAHFADMFFAARERTAQGAYLFFKSRDARVPFCNRSGQCGDSVVEASLALHFAGSLFAMRQRLAQDAYFLFKCLDTRVAHAQLNSHEADILHVGFERDSSLLAACLRFRQRRAHLCDGVAARFARATWFVV